MCCIYLLCIYLFIDLDSFICTVIILFLFISILCIYILYCIYIIYILYIYIIYIYIIYIYYIYIIYLLCVCVSPSLHRSLQRHLAIKWYAGFSCGTHSRLAIFRPCHRRFHHARCRWPIPEYPTLWRSMIPEVVPSVELETKHIHQHYFPNISKYTCQFFWGWLTWKYIW